ncbi:MAG: DUF1430 domain-containing protein [Streptococcaceae bacterium]|jgi:bacteriocin-associated integral membrane protein|nr:DUF1430 domain-containing protein [Streptococcaceae bacterium]
MSNKVIKYVLYALFLVISISGANIINNNIIDNQIMATYNPKNAEQIFLPEQLLSQKNFKSFLITIQGVSKTADTPFTFRVTDIGYKNNGKGKINFNYPENDITFYQIKQGVGSNKRYVSHGINTSFAINDISSFTPEEFIHSDLFISGVNTGNAENLLAKKLNENYGLSLKRDDLINLPTDYQPVEFLYTNASLDLFVAAASIFYVIFLFVWLVENNRKIAINRLHGVDGLTIVSEIFLKEFAIVALFSLIFCSLIIFKGIEPFYLFLWAFFIAVIIAIDYLSILFVSRHSLTNQINNRSFLKFSHIFLYVIKVLIFTISISTTLDTVNLINNTLKINNNASLDNYGVLYPTVLGNISDNGVPMTNFWNLFQKGQDMGAVMSVNSNQTSEFGQNIQMNINFLKNEKITDSTGKKIYLDSDTSEGIVLYSSKLSEKLSDIKKYFTNENNSGFNTQQILYIAIKPNQKIPLYEGTTSPQAGNQIMTEEVSVATVYTKSNIRKNTVNMLLNQGNPYALLFPLQGSLENTYKKLLPALQKDASTSAAPSLIVANEVPSANVMLTVGDVSNYIFTNIFAFLLFVMMIFATTSFYFRVYRKKISILRFQGVSTLRTYRNLGIIVAVQYIYCFVFSLMTGASASIFELFGIYLIIEISIIVTLLRSLEKRVFLDVLKGE